VEVNGCDAVCRVGYAIDGTGGSEGVVGGGGVKPLSKRSESFHYYWR